MAVQGDSVSSASSDAELAADVIDDLAQEWHALQRSGQRGLKPRRPKQLRQTAAALAMANHVHSTHLASQYLVLREDDEWGILADPRDPLGDQHAWVAAMSYVWATRVLTYYTSDNALRSKLRAHARALGTKAELPFRQDSAQGPSSPDPATAGSGLRASLDWPA